VPSDSSEHRLPLLQPFHPTTFLERGVAVPFTTPLLDGSRARPGERNGMELIIPNPSGGRGVYIMPWQAACALCRPTVHDARLNQMLGALNSMTPRLIRRTARHVAEEGLAGDDAMDAACAMAEADRGDRLLTNFLLLMALIEEVEPNHRTRAGTKFERTRELEEYARRTVVLIAPRIGQPAASIAEALEGLADVLYGVGVRGRELPARVPRLLALLQQVCADIATWGRSHSVEDIVGYADMVCGVADLTLDCAVTTVRDAQALSNDMTVLLGRWADEATAIADLAARPEWLLDGWERICLLWTIASDDAARRAALVEMAQLVPVLPREASEWMGVDVASDRPISFRRSVRLNEDWRTGAAVFDLTARNEYLRALAA